MKTVIAATLALFAASAHAGTFKDHAHVVSAAPVYEQVVSEHCDNVAVAEPAQNYPRADLVGGVVGGALGGLAGHQFGHGRGNTAMTIAGALGGAMAGAHVADEHYGNGAQAREVVQRQCSREPHQQLSGYNVTYDYRGQRETVRLPYNPGRELELQVTAQPVSRPSYETSRAY